MKISVSDKIFQQFPDTVEYVVVARGVNNETESSKDILEQSRKIEVEVREKYSGIEWESLPQYKHWLDKYASIVDGVKRGGGKKNVYIPAHVALTRRVMSGKELPNINPVVNFYNSFSVKYGLPFGGEDLSKIVGDLELNFASGDELYLGLGEREIVTVDSGEVIWKDDHSVTCRMWGWRQSKRTAVTRETSDLYFILDFSEALIKSNDLDIEQLVARFANELEKYFSCKTESYKIDQKNRDIVIAYNYDSAKSSFNKENPRKDLERLVTESTVKAKGIKGISKRKAGNLGLVKEDSYLYLLDIELTELLSAIFPIEKVHLQYCSDNSHGDFTTTLALRLAKELKRNPKEIAEEIVDLVGGANLAWIDRISVAPNSFINIKANRSWLIASAYKSTLNFNTFSTSGVGEGRTMLVESPSANPNKPLHVGHLLNLFLGTSLLRMFEKVGFVGEQDTIVNDKGMPIVKTIWALKYLSEGGTPESEGLKPDQFVGKYYVLGSQKFKEDADAKEEIKGMLVKWEAGDKEIIEAWRKMIDWVLEGQLKTAARVWEDFGHLWFESEIYQHGKETIMKYIDGERVEQLEGGAVVGRIEEEYGVPDVVLLKSDGTSLYHTQDIQLTELKIKKFKPWKAIWVVGNEQIMHFQRLFSLLDMLGLIEIDNLYHYAYGYVYGKDGKKMSSRAGQALSGDELLDMMHEAAAKAVEERNVQMESAMSADEISEIVAVNALKFAFLLTDPFKDMRFDIEQSVSFVGKSGSYVMYAYARGMSILRVQNYKTEDIELGELSSSLTDLDHEIIIKSFEYQERFMSATNNYAPSIVAEYIYELAKLFNKFYENESIQNATEEEKVIRLMIVDLVTKILEDGMRLIGMKPLEQM